jgi:hypothetical protein
VLHRLVCGGSDRAADRWREDYRIDGVEGIELHHPIAPRCGSARSFARKSRTARRHSRGAADVLEEELFACRRDLLTTLDIVFMDTTSPRIKSTLGRRGFSKDHRPDLNQMILAVLLDGDGRPVHRDVAGKHRRRDEPDPGDRSPAAPLPHQPRLRRRRPRHDQRRDDRRTRSAQAPLCAGRAPSGPTSWCANSSSTIPPRSFPSF